MESKFHHYSKSWALLMAIEATVAVLVSFYACVFASHLYHFARSEIGGLWGAISAIFILKPSCQEVFDSVKKRFWGSLIGALAPMLCLYIVGGYNVWGFGLSIFVTVVGCALVGQRDTFNVGCITASVIYVVGYITHPYLAPWENALSRLLESVIGMGVAWLIDLSVAPLRKLFDLF